MTVSVCVQCGFIKHGALTPCSDCGFKPVTNEEQAKSMIVTDHFLSHSDLERIAERIRHGEAVTYPQEAVDEYIQMLEENPDIDARVRRYILGFFTVATLAVIALVFAIWYFLS